MSSRSLESPLFSSATPVRQVAVIDIGTSSVRMAVAEIDGGSHVRQLEALAQAVNLGKDAFIRGSISKNTIEECVRVLKSYRRILKEYQIENPAQVRVVATSAVREATNRLAFIDRIYIATGFQVEPLDEAEVIRITYLGLQPFLVSDPALAESRALVTEVGGGSTELLLVKGADVVYSHTYRLGSLRLRETLEALRAPTLKVRNIMETHIHRTVAEITDHVSREGPIELIAMGGDVRFAVRQLLPEWDGRSLARLPLKGLEDFTNKILALSEDRIVRRYRLSYPEAETLGPALLAYVLLAKE
jgi:exopolyphosphatase/guanosine-5'-triphosphate,3'-diphosphate pyrophosphatase